MDKLIKWDIADADRVLRRRQFVKGIAGALLAVGAGVLLTGCPSTSNSTNSSVPPGQEPPLPPAEPTTPFTPPTPFEPPP